MKIKGLTVIFFLALTGTVWINFIDYKFETLSPFAGKEAQLEKIIDNFCLSYIAGYFFYFINVYMVERDEKKSILPYISFKVSSIISCHKRLIQVLKKDNRLKRTYPSKAEFENLLDKRNLDDLKIFNFEMYTLLEYLNYNRKSTLEYISKILESGKHVDDELRVLLFNLRESLFLKKEYAFNSESFDLQTLKKYHNVFYKYSEDVKKLDTYFNKNLKKYYSLNFPMQLRKKIKPNP